MMPPVYNPEIAVTTFRYRRWHRKQSKEKRSQIAKVLSKVGIINSPQVRWLEDALWELKPNSYRIYFGAVGNTICILDGGTKDLQKNQIAEMMELWDTERKQITTKESRQLQSG